MTDLEIRALFGVSLVVTQVALLVPLITRIRRARSSAGVSVQGEAIWVVAGAGWAAYGVATSSTILTVSGVAALIGSTAVLVYIRSALPHSRVWIAMLLTASALVAGGVLGGNLGLAIALSVVGCVQFLPQLAVSFRSLVRPHPAAGVSVIASSLRALYTLGWAFYAGATFLWGSAATSTDWPLAVWGVAGAVAYTLQTVATMRGRAFAS